MEEVMLATDFVLQVIIGRNSSVTKLIEQARRGEIHLVVQHSVLYCAVYSVNNTDTINTRQFAELLKYTEILQDAPQYLGPEERDSWKPSPHEVENWRRLALEEN